jgi:hypothetical protein
VKEKMKDVFLPSSGLSLTLSARLKHWTQTGVARWFVLRPKIPIWVYFGGPYVEWKMWAYFTVILL